MMAVSVSSPCSVNTSSCILDPGDDNEPVISNVFMIEIIIISIIIIILNVGVIISTLQISQSDRFRVTYILLGHLAVNDALIGSILLFGEVYPHEMRTYRFCLIYLGKFFWK